MNRIVIVYKRYFLDFYEIQSSDVQKKTQKTPKKEIEKALRIMEEYNNENKKN